MEPSEHIPDEDEVHRLIDFPFMYDAVKGLIFLNIFQFPNSQPESLVWARHAPAHDDVNIIGCAREQRKRATKPDMRYIGYISSTAGMIRAIVTAAGHGFNVQYAPDEGIYHAEIVFRPANDVPIGRGQRNELKLSLPTAFGGLRPHSCP